MHYCHGDLPKAQLQLCLDLENLQWFTIVYMVEFKLLELAFHYDQDFAPLCFLALGSTTALVHQYALRFPDGSSALGSSSVLYSLISVQYKPSWPARPVSAMSLSPREGGISSLPLFPSCSFSPGFVTFCLAPKGAAWLVEYTQDSESKTWVWIPVSPLWRWLLKVCESSFSHCHVDITSSISQGCCEQYMQWLGKAVSKCYYFHFFLFYFPN